MCRQKTFWIVAAAIATLISIHLYGRHRYFSDIVIGEIVWRIDRNDLCTTVLENNGRVLVRGDVELQVCGGNVIVGSCIDNGSIKMFCIDNINSHDASVSWPKDVEEAERRCKISIMDLNDLKTFSEYKGMRPPRFNW
jgi:hypothetical protein